MKINGREVIDIEDEIVSSRINNLINDFEGMQEDARYIHYLIMESQASDEEKSKILAVLVGLNEKIIDGLLATYSININTEH